MHLAGFLRAGAAGDTLTMELSDTDFPSGTGDATVTSLFAGNIPGDTGLLGYVDASNTLFGTSGGATTDLQGLSSGVFERNGNGHRGPRAGLTRSPGWRFQVSARAQSGSFSSRVDIVPPEGNGDFEGGTPGFWKAKRHLDEWVPTGFDPDDSYEAIFGVDAPGDLTLLEAVKLGGGGVKALMRHSVAALLNAAHPGINYLFSEAEVIAIVQNAFATDDFNTAKDLLAEQNEKPHPL